LASPINWTDPDASVLVASPDVEPLELPSAAEMPGMMRALSDPEQERPKGAAHVASARRAANRARYT
jgi:hypothetical protein